MTAEMLAVSLMNLLACVYLYCSCLCCVRQLTIVAHCVGTDHTQSFLQAAL